MSNFAQLGSVSHTAILTILLVLTLMYGHIMACSFWGVRRWKITIIAFFNLLLYCFVLIVLSTFLYELNLGIETNFISQYLAYLPLWIIVMVILISICIVWLLFCKIHLYKETIITKAAIKESVDNLPTGLCFASENGIIVLANRMMDSLCHIITGRDLQNAEIFWNNLAAGALEEGVERLLVVDNPIIYFPDGRTWSFHRRSIDIGGKVITEFTATDTTDLNTLRIQLEENNKILQDMNIRLSQYDANILKGKEKEERLAIKMGIHDGFGYVLLAIRQFFKRGEADDITGEKMDDILEIWRENTKILKGSTKPEKNLALSTLVSTAKAIGIEIIIRGKFPEDEPKKRTILIVMGECLKNSVRHANASELYLEIRESPESYVATFTNNGIIPRTKIIEGGGLSSIRRKIEAMGGVMELSHRPQFTLIVTIPRGDVG